MSPKWPSGRTLGGTSGNEGGKGERAGCEACCSLAGSTSSKTVSSRQGVGLLTATRGRPGRLALLLGYGVRWTLAWLVSLVSPMSEEELFLRHLAEVKQALADERAEVAKLAKQVSRLRSRCRRLGGMVDTLRGMLAEVWSGEEVSGA